MCLLEAIMNFTMLAVFTQISRLNNSLLSFSLSICLETDPSLSHYVAKICFRKTFTQIGSLSLQFPQAGPRLVSILIATTIPLEKTRRVHSHVCQTLFGPRICSAGHPRDHFITYVCVVMKRMVMIMMATLIWWWEMWGRAQTEVYLGAAGAQCARVLGNTKHSTVKHSMCAR